MIRTLSFCTVALWAAVALFPVDAEAQSPTTWDFSVIADSSTELASFSVPAVNDAGQVAFVASFRNEALGQALYRADGNVGLTPIATANPGGAIRNFLGDPALSADGVVAVVATLDDGSVSVLAGSATAVVTVANTLADGLTSIDSKPFISDSGVVLVRAVRAIDGARLLLKGTGAGAPTTLLDSTGAYDPVNVAGINSSGEVAFEALAGGFKGVYRTTDGITVTPVAVESNGGFTDVKALDINNNGTVVFFTETAAGVQSLNVDTTGTPVLFADTSGLTFASFGPVAVAESGATAFRGVFKQGLDAIFAGGTGLYARAIAIGDGLLGRGVTALDTGPQAVTNGGNFVFRASRNDGSSGIYAATPRVVSSSGGGGSAVDLLTMATLLLPVGCLRRRRDFHRRGAGAPGARS